MRRLPESASSVCCDPLAAANAHSLHLHSSSSGRRSCRLDQVRVQLACPAVSRCWGFQVQNQTLPWYDCFLRRVLGCPWSHQGYDHYAEVHSKDRSAVLREVAVADEAWSWRKTTGSHKAEEEEVHVHCYGALQKNAHAVVEEQTQWSLREKGPAMASREAMPEASHQRLITAMRWDHSMAAWEFRLRLTWRECLPGLAVEEKLFQIS